ncbi:MAG: hypothetical protein AAGJ79_13395 [Verrucomicrobiota bacterium]
MKAPDGQIDLVAKLAGVGLMAGMLISWRLWMSAGRVFPEVPLIPFFPDLPVALNGMLYGGCLTAILFMLRGVRQSALSVMFVFLVVLLLGDQMRWQPWVWHYGLLLGAFALFRSSGRPLELSLALKMITIAFYFWAGFHKLGGPFEDFYGSALAKRWIEEAPLLISNLIAGGGKFIPWIEILTAVLLAVPQLVARRIGVLLACFVHLGILSWLVSMNLNHVVWSWNVVAPLIVFFLFWPRAQRAGESEKTGTSFPSIVLLGVLGALTFIAPALSWTQRWDRSLSFHLYSGRAQRVLLALTEETLENKAPDLKPWAKPSPHWPRMMQVDLEDWALNELNVAFVGEDRVVLALSKTLTERFSLDETDTFFYRDFPKVRTLGWGMWRARNVTTMRSLPDLQPLPDS